MTSKSKLTLSDIAQIAGVSTSTASRALNDNPVIKKSTRERIQAIAKENRFNINTSASRLRTQKSNVIAVILNIDENTEQSVSDPFLLKIVADLNLVLNRHGYELLLSNSLMATDDWAGYFIGSQRADGLLVIGQGKDDHKLHLASDSGVPMVVWGSPVQGSHYTIVGSDNYLGGTTATQHLINKGCRSLLFLGDAEHCEIKERYAGFIGAIEKHDNACQHLLVSSDITSGSAYSKISDILKQKGLFFDGIVAASDMVAIGAIKALKERYIGIPKEVAIIGYDGINIAEVIHPSLSTIEQNTKEAAELMVKKLLSHTPKTKTTFTKVNINLRERDST